MACSSRAVHKELYKPIHAGASIDVANLYEKYKELNTCSFEPFAKLYSDCEFTSIYLGHHSAEELVEFSERLLQITVSYIFPPNFDDGERSYTVNRVDSLESQRDNSYVAQIFGIYLTYSLFSLQPNRHVCSIRVTPKHFNYLHEAVERFADKGDLDASFCLFRLFDSNAFQIYAFDRDYEMLSRPKHTYKDDMPMFKSKSKNLAHLTSLKNDSYVQQLQRVHQEYQKMKEKLFIPSAGPSNAFHGPAEELGRLEAMAVIACRDIDKPAKQSIYSTRKATRDRAAKGKRGHSESEEGAAAKKKKPTVADDPTVQHMYDSEHSLRNATKLHEFIETEMEAETSGSAHEPGISRSKTAPAKPKASKKGKASEAAKDVLLSPRKRLFSDAHELLKAEDVSLALNEEAEALEAEADLLFESLKRE
uniref:Histone acetyltransferase type B catalytic subunit n=1 Tax=Steinernema glaseri TaxID=37863 RepID=A0A1I7Z792_9BILA